MRGEAGRRLSKDKNGPRSIKWVVDSETALRKRPKVQKAPVVDEAVPVSEPFVALVTLLSTPKSRFSIGLTFDFRPSSN